jgi:agrin
VHIKCSKRGQHCVSGLCVCRTTVCPTLYEPVCGTDFVTYPNQCTLDSVACSEDLDIETLYVGVCADELGSADMPEAVQSVGTAVGSCDASECLYGAVCHQDHCVCVFNCDAVRSAVCGSDGKLYASECLMRQEACKMQTDVRVLPIDNCQDVELEVEVCDGKPTLVNPRTGSQYNCANESCPPGSYCHKVHNVPARCCLEDGPAAAAAADVHCHSTQFGCCSDGLTTALGPLQAGCPACRCNVFGAVRDDCDQTTGRCLCRAGITGPRCDTCPNGSTLSAHGCSST